MNKLEERFNAAIKDAGFNVFEISGFKSKPHLALKAGMAIGYRIALDDIASSLTLQGDKMGESLYQKWLNEEVENITETMLRWGIEGMLSEFEMWLQRKDLIKES